MHAVLTVTVSGTGAEVGRRGSRREDGAPDRRHLGLHEREEVAGGQGGHGRRHRLHSDGRPLRGHHREPPGVAGGRTDRRLSGVAGSGEGGREAVRGRRRDGHGVVDTAGGGDVLGDEPGIRHAILLTDGKNESEEPEDLEEALADADGAFQCDCRGVGDSWDVGELRKVATALRGSYDIVAEPEELERDFSELMQASLLRQVAEITLRVWTPQGAEVAALKQMEPPLDLTGSRAVIGPLVGDYTTGSWGDECRDYYLSVRVPAGEVDDKMLAARVTLVVGDEPAGQGLVTAEWTDDVGEVDPHEQAGGRGDRRGGIGRRHSGGRRCLPGR